MKKLMCCLSAVCILALGISSCAAGRCMKRDCQGGQHVRLKNGIWI